MKGEWCRVKGEGMKQRGKDVTNIAHRTQPPISHSWPNVVHQYCMRQYHKKS